MNPIIKPVLLAVLCTCQQPGQPRTPASNTNPFPTIGAIPLPAGYTRLPSGPNTFTTWLRRIPLKKDRTVYLYNGTPKPNQQAQSAVLNVSVGQEDLQQCADAVMRLRAEFLYAGNDFSRIRFYTDQGTCLGFRPPAGPPPATRVAFDHYLTYVFKYCGTHSLEKQLQQPKPIISVASGDVLIKGGWPGHAMIVVDAAEDKQGHRIYLLAQSYMPAQDIHIVVNPGDPLLSPWYAADQTQSLIETPEWTFTINQLRSWPEQN